jgi:hypothetical protein
LSVALPSRRIQPFHSIWQAKRAGVTPPFVISLLFVAA